MTGGRLRMKTGLVPLWVGLLLLTFLAFRPPPTLSQETALFQTAQMTEVSLPGVKVRLGRPIQVTASHGRAYIPTIARFSGGELIVSYSLVADTNENPANVRAFQISHDGGRTWGRNYEVLPEHQPMIYVPSTDGSLMAIPAQLYPRRPGEKQNFQAAHIRIEPGGKFILEPGGVQVVDWPWPVEVNQRPVPEANWFVRMAFDGSALRLDDGRLIATGYARKGEERLQRNILFVSGDEGRTWRYYATISSPDILSDPQQPGAGGPSETALIRLQDKDLMAVFRVGNGREWNLRRAYSSDDGRTWSQAETLPAHSVEPSMLLADNGTILLSCGRPGIQLWLSTDPRGRIWQKVDIVEHHNRRVPDDTYRIFSYSFKNPRGMNTWSYTELVQVEPNRFLLVYDRIPPAPDLVAYGPPLGEYESPQAARLSWTPDLQSGERFRVFVLPVEVVRD